MMLVHGPHFEKHCLECTYLVCLGSRLTNKSQLLSISEFPSRVNPNLPFLLEDPVLSAIAKKHKQTPALVALRYQIQRGVVVLAKSYNKKRIKENIQVMMSGAVGRGLLRNILHKGHSLSNWGQIWLPCPLFLSPFSWRGLQSPGEAWLLAGRG